MNLKEIREGQRAFVKERAWEKFHSPKNLVMAMAGETGELLEIFQWLSEKESYAIMGDPKKAEAVRHELADIFYYLCRLTDLLDVDLEKAFWEKLELNKKRYPASLVKGTAKKYTELGKAAKAPKGKRARS